MDTVRFAWWRLRRSRLGWRCVVAVLALCTFASVRAALGAASRVGAVAEVVVAAHDLAPGAVLSPADLGRRRVPQALAPPASPPAGALVGAVVRSAVYAGEPLTAARLGAGGPITGQLLAGEAALAVPAGRPPLAAQPGDRVRLLLAGDPLAGAPPERAVIEGRVLSADEESLTVAVPGAAAAAVAAALVGGAVTPALLGPP